MIKTDFSKNSKTTTAILLAAATITLLLLLVLVFFSSELNFLNPSYRAEERKKLEGINERLDTNFNSLKELNDRLGTDYKSTEEVEIADEAPDTGFDASSFDEEFKENSNMSSSVYGMIPDLPYDGSNFSLYYSFENDSFTLFINQKNPAAGREEFSEFIKSYGIESDSWIKNLEEVSLKPTPEP